MPLDHRRPKFVRPGCDDGVMSSTASSGAAVVSPAERLEVLFEELSELAGQRNAIDGRIVEIAAEMERDSLWGGAPRVRGRWRRWWPGRPGRLRPTRAPSLPSRTGRRSFPAALRACGRAGCRWIRS